MVNLNWWSKLKSLSWFVICLKFMLEFSSFPCEFWNLTIKIYTSWGACQRLPNELVIYKKKMYGSLSIKKIWKLKIDIILFTFGLIIFWSISYFSKDFNCINHGEFTTLYDWQLIVSWLFASQQPIQTLYFHRLFYFNPSNLD